MMFASDNWSGAPPQIVEAIAKEAAATSNAYGSSPTDDRARALLSDLFECDIDVFFVGTGTAANSIGLAGLSKPGGLVLCHQESHICVDECGSVGFQGDASRLQTVTGTNGLLDPDDLKQKIEAIKNSRVAFGQATAISLTQATESGTVYSLDQIQAITDIAKYYGLPVHMDGARFSNAAAFLDVSPAEMTWRSGVDMLSFGATKNGCIAAEALIVFDQDRARDVEFRQMRAGHVFSKTRFMSAQFIAYLTDGLWLELAGHANAMADQLRDVIRQSNTIRLAWPTDVNEVFAILSNQTLEDQMANGLVCAPWEPSEEIADIMSEDERLVRLVTSFATQPENIQRFAESLSGA